GIGRVGEIGNDGVRLRRASVNLRQFELRPGERLAVGEIFGRRVRNQRVVDIGLTASPEPFGWEVATIALGSRRVPGLRRSPEIVILSPQATVAEALARVRSPDLAVPVAAQVFVTQPPLETPTGRYLGMVGIQRPSGLLGASRSRRWIPTIPR